MIALLVTSCLGVAIGLIFAFRIAKMQYKKYFRPVFTIVVSILTSWLLH